jgi:hypothetical protein
MPTVGQKGSSTFTFTHVDQTKGSSQNWLKPKKTKLFSLSLNPLPPQMTKKHRCLASFILFKT